MSTLISKDAEEPDVDSQWVKKLDEIDRLGDPLRMYLHEIGNIKHLTAAHERWLARKMEEGTYIEDLEAEFRDLTRRDCKGVDLLRFFMTQIHRAVPLINMICRFYNIRKPQSLKDLLTDKGLNDRLHGELPEEMLKYVAVMSAAFRNTSPEEIKGEIQDLSLMLRSLPKDVQGMFAISPNLTLLNVLENMIIYKRPVEDYELLLKRHFNYMKSIGVRAKQHFTLASLHLVVSAAKNYSDKGMSQADLIQEGNIGLLRAVEEFDYRVGTQFKAYASYWITQAMLRATADQARTIRIPVYMVENINKLQSVTRRLERELGRPPTVEEIGVKMDVSPERVREIRGFSRRPLSLETPIGIGKTLGELITVSVEDVFEPAPADAASYNLLKEQVEDVLLTLNERESRVLQLRFGLEDGRSRTLEEVGRDFNVGRERIRQIEAKALRKLRHPNRSKKLRDFLE